MDDPENKNKNPDAAPRREILNADLFADDIIFTAGCN